MGDFKLSLKNTAAAALIITCAALTFWSLGQNKKSSDNNTSPGEFTGYVTSRPQSGIVSKDPIMPKGFGSNTSWRNPFAAPVEITGPRPKPPSPSPAPGAPGDTGSGLAASGASLSTLPGSRNLPSLAGIVASQNRRMAIIRHKGVGRAYSEGEQVGNYLLLQILEKEVILQDHTGQHNIRLP